MRRLRLTFAHHFANSPTQTIPGTGVTICTASPSHPSSSGDPAGPPEKRARVDATHPTVVQCTRCLHSITDADANFCSNCGSALGVQAASVEVQIEGFLYGPGGLKCTEDDWDGLRASLQEFFKIRGVKDEASDSDGEMLPDASDSSDSIHVIENYVEKIWCLQEGIDKKFRNGVPIETLVDKLKQSLVNPMTGDFLILNVARANIRERRSCKRSVRYYTFDHRRLWCMYHAGCRAVRVRVTRSGRDWDEFFNKADGLGRLVTELEVRE